MNLRELTDDQLVDVQADLERLLQDTNKSDEANEKLLWDVEEERHRRHLEIIDAYWRNAR